MKNLKILHSVDSFFFGEYESKYLELSHKKENKINMKFLHHFCMDPNGRFTGSQIGQPSNKTLNNFSKPR
jgi:hypothetical protein